VRAQITVELVNRFQRMHRQTISIPYRYQQKYIELHKSSEERMDFTNHLAVDIVVDERDAITNSHSSHESYRKYTDP
jgi:phage regulator Rha-like protein